jgi:hypothetical protein
MTADGTECREELREILLAYLVKELRGWQKPNASESGRLQSLRVSLKTMQYVFRVFFPGRGDPFGDDIERRSATVERYSQCRGVAIDQSGEEFDWIVARITPFAVWSEFPDSGMNHSFHDRIDVRAATDALLDYRASDVPLSDDLLAAAIGTYDEVEEIDERFFHAVAELGPASAVKGARHREAERQALLERYRRAWIRWLELRLNPDAT